MAEQKTAGKIKITLIKSVICSNSDVRGTVKSLGLGKLNSSVIQSTTPDILGKVRRVQHLVAVEEVK
jgi:large subunit ribosomal protein L30